MSQYNGGVLVPLRTGLAPKPSLSKSVLLWVNVLIQYCQYHPRAIWLCQISRLLYKDAIPLSVWMQTCYMFYDGHTQIESSLSSLILYSCQIRFISTNVLFDVWILLCIWYKSQFSVKSLNFDVLICGSDLIQAIKVWANL